MSIKQVKLATQAQEQLMRLKTRTGIPHWNVLCRWAFCLSLRQPAPPAPLDIPTDSNVEMTWQVFGGDAHELYLALLKERCERDWLGCSDEVLVLASFDCICTEALVIWPRRDRFARLLISSSSLPRKNLRSCRAFVGRVFAPCAHLGDLRSRLRAGRRPAPNREEIPSRSEGRQWGGDRSGASRPAPKREEIPSRSEGRPWGGDPSGARDPRPTGAGIPSRSEGRQWGGSEVRCGLAALECGGLKPAEVVDDA